MNEKTSEYTPHPTSEIFKTHQIPNTVVALKIKRSYPLVCQVLKGSVKPSDEVDRRLRDLADQVSEP